MKVTFLGATHEVTGSCTLIECGNNRGLVDCGMEQGEDIFQNVPLPVPANAIEAVFLTHAHIDHSGMLPKLCKDGFRGQIYATEATCNLCRIMLMDSAHIQESEAQWRTRKAERAGERAVEPVYDTNDAAAALRLLKPGGVIAIALYYGGANGYGERDAVMTWLETLDDRKFSVLRCDWANRRNDPPVPIFIWKE